MKTRDGHVARITHDQHGAAIVWPERFVAFDVTRARNLAKCRIVGDVDIGREALDIGPVDRLSTRDQVGRQEAPVGIARSGKRYEPDVVVVSGNHAIDRLPPDDEISSKPGAAE